MVSRRQNPNHLASILLCFPLISTFTSALFSPPDNHLIACGAASAGTLEDGRTFFPDDPGRSLSSFRELGRSIRLKNPSPDAAPLHRTARVFYRPSSYEFKVKDNGTHFIRLHFYPFDTANYNLSASLFHVLASDFILLSDFGTAIPAVKEYLIYLDEGKLVISFAPAEKSAFAFVNAIEVVSAPKDLILDIARLVKPDEIAKFHGLSKEGFETLYRINVGGPRVTPFNDTLRRTWVPDADFLKLDAASKIVKFSGRIKFQRNGASREVAPDNVYNSARIIHSSSVAGTNYSMAWEFPVDPGSKYLVRMHFCDIASLALNQLYFNVYINGYLAYEDFDLSDATGQQLASPYYVDFVLDVDGSEHLSIVISPSKLSSPSWIQGLLNGMEIMKINNKIGNLDAKSPVVLAFEDPVRLGLGTFVRSLTCGFAFMSLVGIAMLLFLRRRDESRGLVDWSLLPADVSDGKFKGSLVLPGKLVDF